MNKAVSRDGTAIAFGRSGDGPPVILVGGALSDRLAVAPVAALLAPHFTVIGYDRRGRGDSGDTPPYAVEREVEDIDALINDAGGPAFVCGMSSGAALALEAAARGLAITKLALYEPPFIVDDNRPPEIGVRHMKAVRGSIAVLAFAALWGVLLLGCAPAVRPAASLPGAPVSTAGRTSPITEPAPTTGGAATPIPQPTGAESASGGLSGVEWEIQEYPVPPGSHPHDVAPASDGSVWYTAQTKGQLGRLDPSTGETHHIELGERSAPHGVIVGPDGALWITDGGLNSIVRVDPVTEDIHLFPLPPGSARANLNTAAFDSRGVLWFTGQSGVYGWLNPVDGEMQVIQAPGGPGPYGITTTPDGNVYYASLGGSHIARIDVETGSATVIQPPTAGQGARRVWADSKGRIWVSEWNAGQVAVYDPKDDSWREWRLPGQSPRAYAVYVDDLDGVWLSDFGANSLVRFDPERESFTSYPLPSPSSDVRQLLGRAGEVWGAESGADSLVVARRR